MRVIDTRHDSEVDDMDIDDDESIAPVASGSRGIAIPDNNIEPENLDDGIRNLLEFISMNLSNSRLQWGSRPGRSR